MVFHPALPGKWLPIFQYLPRWMQVNYDYGQTDGYLVPSTSTESQISTISYAGSTSYYPTSWTFSSSAVSGLDHLEALGFALSNALNELYVAQDYVDHINGMSFSYNESEYVWVLGLDTAPSVVQIQLDDSTWFTLPFVYQNQLLRSYRPCWTYENKTLFIAGLGYKPVNTESASGSKRLKYLTQWSGFGPITMRHPCDGGQVALLADTTKLNGLIEYKDVGQEVYARFSNLNELLPTIQLKVDGYLKTADLADVWSSLEDVGEILDLPRLRNETLSKYSLRLRPSLQSLCDQSTRDFKFLIASKLGMAEAAAFTGSSVTSGLKVNVKKITPYKQILVKDSLVNKLTKPDHLTFAYYYSLQEVSNILDQSNETVGCYGTYDQFSDTTLTYNGPEENEPKCWLFDGVNHYINEIQQPKYWRSSALEKYGGAEFV